MKPPIVTHKRQKFAIGHNDSGNTEVYKWKKNKWVWISTTTWTLDEIVPYIKQNGWKGEGWEW